MMVQVLEYEYEPEMEDTYRNSMLKTFRKTLDDGFFPFIILDAINEKVKYFDQFWSAAKTKGFEVSCLSLTVLTGVFLMLKMFAAVSRTVSLPTCHLSHRCMWLK